MRLALFDNVRQRRRRMHAFKEAAKLLVYLRQAGVVGASGLALSRKMGISEERLQDLLTLLVERGLVKEITYSKMVTWACRNGFVPADAAKRRWTLTAAGVRAVHGS